MKLSILSFLALAASSITVTASMVADLGYNEQVDDSDWKIQALIHHVIEKNRSSYNPTVSGTETSRPSRVIKTAP
jgi:hypothetical protein